MRRYFFLCRDSGYRQQACYAVTDHIWVHFFNHSICIEPARSIVLFIHTTYMFSLHPWLNQLLGGVSRINATSRAPFIEPEIHEVVFAMEHNKAPNLAFQLSSSVGARCWVKIMRRLGWDEDKWIVFLLPSNKYSGGVFIVGKPSTT
jgi:hypothetical protein